MLKEDPTVAGHRDPGAPAGPGICRRHHHPQGLSGRGARPQFLAARTYQRTSYLPGEIGQVDWWHLPLRLPVAERRARKVYGLVVTLPHSAAHACFFTHAKTLHDFLPALVGCLVRLGGVPQGLVLDNDTSMVVRVPGEPLPTSPRGGRALRRASGQSDVLPPRRPTSKGQVERTVGLSGDLVLAASHLHETSPICRPSTTPGPRRSPIRRFHRRVGARVADAYRVEKDYLGPLPGPLPETDQHLETRISKDAFVRAAGADYSVPPGLVGRRVQVRLSLSEVFVFLEGREIARHARSYVPADVVIDPDHARALLEPPRGQQALCAVATFTSRSLILPAMTLFWG